MQHWSFQPIFESYAAVAAIAAVLAMLLLIGPTFHTLSRWRRRTLVAMRVGMILLLVVAMLRPQWESVTTQPLTATLVVMLDQSRSMEIADVPGASGDITRFEAQRDAIQKAIPALKALVEDMDVKIYTYNTSATRIFDSTLEQDRKRLQKDDLGIPDHPTGDQTDIGSAMDDTLLQEDGERLVAVILLGDGHQQAVAPRIEFQQPAAELGDLKCPLHTICFGQARDQKQAADVIATSFPDRIDASEKIPETVSGSILVYGFAGVEIPVQLVLVDDHGKEKIVSTVRTRVDEDGRAANVRISFMPPPAGRYKLMMRAVVQPGEASKDNNQLTAFLNVTSKTFKILYLEGTLRTESKFLRRAIGRAKYADVDFMWIDSRNREKWPIDVAEKITDPDYKIIILGDLDAAALGETNLKLLAQQISHGKGLLLLGGYHSFGPGGYANTPLARVLPVTLDNIRQSFDRPILSQLHHKGPIQMVPFGNPLLMRLEEEDQANQKAWASLRPLLGANRFLGRTARSSLLAESPKGDPLLVAGEWGDGRVLIFAGDSTWQWCLQSDQGQRYHKRFWRQAIYWLARHKEEQDVWVKLDKRRVLRGGEVSITAGVISEDGNVVSDANLTAKAILPDKTEIEIELRSGETHFTGMFSETELLGDYTIVVEATREETSLGEAQSRFLVFYRDLEKEDAAARPAALASLSRLTAKAGGKSWAAENLSQLLKEIKDQPPVMEIEHPQRWQFADTWYDAWSFLLLFVGLLTAEWYLRKKWGLV